MDDAIHNSPYPLVRMTTGLMPKSSAARRVAFEVLMHEAYGSEEFHWTQDNNGERLEIRVTDSGQRTWSAWMKLGELDPQHPDRDLALAGNVLMWGMLRDAISEVHIRLRNQVWKTP